MLHYLPFPAPSLVSYFLYNCLMFHLLFSYLLPSWFKRSFLHSIHALELDLSLPFPICFDLFRDPRDDHCAYSSLT